MSMVWRKGKKIITTGIKRDVNKKHHTKKSNMSGRGEKIRGEKKGKGLISGAINLVEEKSQANMHITCLCYMCNIGFKGCFKKTNSNVTAEQCVQLLQVYLEK